MVERKLATVLFVDLVDSTRLVGASDPEVVRRRQTQFFEHATRCVTAHGGIVEKYAGDAVMAAFGVPQAHEDDAERATRAGLAILEATRDLGLEARAGLESGEIVFDDRDSTFATGEAVHLAARLQQAAQPGELLLGPAAFRLTLGRIDVEDNGPVEMRGRDEPVWTWKAICPSENVRRVRSLAASLIGRDAELELLRNTFERSARDRRAHLFTIYGEPGVGKSRLAFEFAEGVEGATVLTGRALPYGEGVTYWPLAEMVKAAAGISDDEPLGQAHEKLVACCEDEAVADLLGLAVGVLEAVERERAQHEIAWAARQWAEQIAKEQPLVLVFEDIHWAEEPLLELIEHLVQWVRHAPLLIVCLARPELLDIRPGWGGGRVRATSIELEPLTPAESEQLLDELLEDIALPRDQVAEVIEKTGGNPLFVEETIRMLAEGGAQRIPDTVQALIAARVDGLEAASRRALQCAAVMGRTFWRSALAHLVPSVDDAQLALDDLVAREFVLPAERSSIAGEDAFRFKHVLIREVAYAGLSKANRATLHERYAEWLAERAGEELLEIRAYHLERAASLLDELEGDVPPELRRAAAEALEGAGKRALSREANRAARKLLVRAVELEATPPRRRLAAQAAWRLGDLPAVAQEMAKVLELAQADGDRATEGRALTALAEVALRRDSDFPRAEALAEQAAEALADEPSEALFDALHLRQTVAWWSGDLDRSERYARQMVEIARELGRKDLEAAAVDLLASAALATLDVERAAPLADEALALAEESGSIVSRATALMSKASVHRWREELDAAEELWQQARVSFEEVGASSSLARVLNNLAVVAEKRGDVLAAEKYLREAVRILKPLEDRGTLCETQRDLAENLVVQGRIDEAERWALEARDTVGDADWASVATTTMALGLVRAAQGRDGEAEALLREALAQTEVRGFPRNLLQPLEALANFLRDRGRGDEAEVYEQRLAELLPVRSARVTTVR